MLSHSEVEEQTILTAQLSEGEDADFIGADHVSSESEDNESIQADEVHDIVMESSLLKSNERKLRNGKPYQEFRTTLHTSEFKEDEEDDDYVSCSEDSTSGSEADDVIELEEVHEVVYNAADQLKESRKTKGIALEEDTMEKMEKMMQHPPECADEYIH